MGWIVAAAIAIAAVALGALAQRRGWIDLSSRGFRERSRNGGAPLGALDEVFSPNRYEIQLQQDAQRVIPASAPIPGDGERPDLGSGRIRLDVPGGAGPRAGRDVSGS